MVNSGLCWHVYHDGLIDWCFDIKARQEEIRYNKPASEIPIRLLRLKLVATPMGDAQFRGAYYTALGASDKAWEAYYTIKEAPTRDWVTYYRARDAYYTAQDAAETAWVSYMETISPEELDAAHRAECPDCSWNGKTLFPARRRKGVAKRGRTL